MTWTYNPVTASTDDRNYIRLRIGDTSSGDPLLQDEEIDAFLDSEGDRLLAAAAAAESVGGRFARRTDKTVGRLRIAGQQGAQGFFELAARLRAEAGRHVTPYAGGISVAEKQAVAEDSDTVQPAFSRGMHDFTQDVGSAEGSSVA